MISYKRIITLFLCLILACATLAPVRASGVYDLPTAVVNNPNPADRLNLRTAPSSGASSLGRYYNGTRVRILEYTNADWVKVWIGPSAGVADGNHQDPNMGYIQGYMSRRYLAFGSAGDRVAWAGSWAQVNGSDSRVYPLRSAINGDRSIVSLPNRAMLQVIGVNSDWYHVVYDAFTGFMPASELKIVSGGSSGGGSTGGELVARGSELDLKQNLKYYVYSGPGSNYLRGADGKAAVATNDTVEVYGVTRGYLFVSYPINSTTWRFGYITEDAIAGPSYIPDLEFKTVSAAMRYDCALTDDPYYSRAPLRQIRAGTSVTCLTLNGAYVRAGNYVYIEVRDGVTAPARGFVPADAI
ncbi:MAG: SH3 domain-containing protein [Oscillospiraceae bacterium]|nr:SH3 domain-containing protein [Oscillospiraceae bacterium]